MLMNETIMPDESGSAYPVPTVSLSASGAGPQPVSGGTGLDPQAFRTSIESIGQTIADQGFGAGLAAYKNSAELRETNKMDPSRITAIASNANPKNETPVGIGVNALARGLDTTNKVIQVAEQLGIDMRTGPRSPEEKAGFFDSIKAAFKNSQIQPGSIDEVAQRDYFTALFTGKGLNGAMEAFGNRYNQLADEQRKQKMAIQNKIIENEIAQAGVVEKYKTGEQLGAQARTDVANRAITSMDKYRPTVITTDEATGKVTETPVSEDNVNIAKQLIGRAVETGDFETVRNRAKALGISGDWFDNALNNSQMDLARREAAIEASTGKKASQHWQGGVMLQDAKGNLYQRATLNGKPVYTSDKNPNVPLSPAQIAAIGPLTEFGKSPADKFAGAAATAEGTAEGKNVSEFADLVGKKASAATSVLEDNAAIRDILTEFPNIVGKIGQIDDPLAQTALKAIEAGIQVGNFGSISIPVETLLASSKLSKEERDALTKLNFRLAKGSFNAVAEAGFKGSQSDKEFAEIQKAVPKEADSANAIIYWTKINDSVQKINQARADAWINYTSITPVGKRNTVEFNARFDREIAGPALASARKEAEQVFKKGPTAQAAPGSKPSPSSKPSNSGLPPGFTRDANGVIRKTK